MKKQLAAITMMALMLPGAHAQTVLSNLTMYWNANTAAPTTTNSSNGAFDSWISVSPTFTQFNNFGTTTLINSSSASSGYTGASGGNNFGLAVGTLNSVNATPFSINGPAFAFTVTLSNADHRFVLTDFDFGSRRTGSGPQAITLLASSSANFATNVVMFNLTSGQSNSAWVFNEPTITNGNAFNATNQVFFRLYGYNGVNNAAMNTANWRIDDITIAGSVIPEPSTYALMALALVGILFFARRRKAASKA